MKWYIYGAWAVLVLSLIGLAVIVWQTEPGRAPASLKILFFAALFLVIWDIATLIIFSVKKQFLRSHQLGKTAYESAFYVSLLQGLISPAVIYAMIFAKKIF